MLMFCEKQEVKDEDMVEISPTKSKTPKSRKREAPIKEVLKEESFEFDDNGRPLRSSRTKVANYYAAPAEAELPKIPKATKPSRGSKKKELEAERGTYYALC